MYVRRTTELDTDRPSALKVLTHLLQIKSDTFENLGTLLSGERKRKIIFKEPDNDKTYGEMVLTIDSPNEEHCFTGIYHSDEGHAYFKLPGDSYLDDTLEIKKIENLETSCHTPGNLIRFIPGYLHRIIEWKNTTIEDIAQKLQTYKVSKTELNELSQGLQDKKCTLLHTALAKGREDLVRYFLELGLNPNQADSNGETPLYYACFMYPNLSMAKILVEAGAHPNALHNGETLLQKLVRQYTPVKDIDFVIACITELKMDPFIKDKHQKTIFQRSLAHVENEKLTRFLIDAGFGAIDDTDEYGYTALHHSAYKEDGFHAAMCLRLGADPHKKNNIGWTPFDKAASQSNLEMMKILYERGVSIDTDALLDKIAEGYNHEKALQCAQWALEKGASLDQKNRSGETPLFKALVFGKNLLLISLSNKVPIDILAILMEEPLYILQQLVDF